MRVYIEITHTDAMDAHGFIGIFGEKADTLIPISMPLQSYQQGIENMLFFPRDRHEAKEDAPLAQTGLFNALK